MQAPGQEPISAKMHHITGYDLHVCTLVLWLLISTAASSSTKACFKQAAPLANIALGAYEA